MLLLIRFAVILLLIGCVIAIPLFLMKLNELEKRKKAEEQINQRIKQTEPQKPVARHSFATDNVQQRFHEIEEKLHALKVDKKWLTLESAHTATETFPSDYQKYKEAYLKLSNKKEVEVEVLPILDRMIEELRQLEGEIEEKKKAALDRQGYIIENREKNHL